MIRMISKALSSARTSAQKELHDGGKTIAILARTLHCSPGAKPRKTQPSAADVLLRPPSQLMRKFPFPAVSHMPSTSKSVMFLFASMARLHNWSATGLWTRGRHWMKSLCGAHGFQPLLMSAAKFLHIRTRTGL